jgi:superfamily II DNA or RNA helicase
MELRDYQIEIIEKVYKSWEKGAKNVLMQLPTGGGKTRLFCSIISTLKIPTVIIVHRVELIGQISLTLASYGVKHNVVTQAGTIREIITLQMQELHKSYYDPNAPVTVIGVDTLIRFSLQAPPAWIKCIKLVIQDEAHHVLRKNKWGKAAEYFPQAQGLYPTATPRRADGNGLGRHADGVIDEMIIGPTIRELINKGHLSDYIIYAPKSDLILEDVPVSAGGDYSPQKLRVAVHKSRITGDVVKHYLKIASGKSGVTFAVDIKAATEIAANFRLNGVKAEVVSSKTPELLRANIMRQFRNKEIMQLVNVDILGEGVDVPSIEVVSMARPTQSYALFLQQFGRALRPFPGKTHAIIIDHVDNVNRHRLPDHVNNWSLNRKERRGAIITEGIPVRTCLNESCMRVYERTHNKCPFCGYRPEVGARSNPSEVDGDLHELSPQVLAALRGEISRIDNPAHPPRHLEGVAQRAIIKNHNERQLAQKELRDKIALWAGKYKQKNIEDSIIYRTFYFNFNVDIATAQTLGKREADLLTEKIVAQLRDFV